MNKLNKLDIDQLSNIERIALALMPLGWEITHQDHESLRAKDLENDWLFEDSMLKVWYAYGEYHFALTYADDEGITNIKMGQADDIRGILQLICEVDMDDYERPVTKSDPWDEEGQFKGFNLLNSKDDDFKPMAADFQQGVEMLRQALQKVDAEEDESGHPWLAEDSGYTAWPPGTIAQLSGVTAKPFNYGPETLRAIEELSNPCGYYPRLTGDPDGYGYFTFPNHPVFPTKVITLQDCLDEVDPDDMTEEELREFIRLGFFKR